MEKELIFTVKVDTEDNLKIDFSTNGFNNTEILGCIEHFREMVISSIKDDEETKS